MTKLEIDTKDELDFERAKESTRADCSYSQLTTGCTPYRKRLTPFANSGRPSAVGNWSSWIMEAPTRTKEIIHSFMDRLPLTYVFEPARGKNAALNTGLASVEGDLVVLTDDDTLPRPDWLIEIRRAADSQPSFSVFGGTVLPHWEVRPEEWILAWVQLGPVFARYSAFGRRPHPSGFRLRDQHGNPR